jgi:hypothetical protein
VAAGACSRRRAIGSPRRRGEPSEIREFKGALTPGSATREEEPERTA